MLKKAIVGVVVFVVTAVATFYVGFPYLYVEGAPFLFVVPVVVAIALAVTVVAMLWAKYGLDFFRRIFKFVFGYMVL